MKTLGNIIWHFPFLGFLNALFTYVLGLLLTATVVAAPIGLGLMEFSKLLIWPFGNAMISKKQLNIEQNEAWGTYSKIIGIVYFPFGLFLTIVALFQIVFLFFSIFGIPAALVLVKSLGAYLNPVNKKCVPSALIEELDRRKASDVVDMYLGKKDIGPSKNQEIQNFEIDLKDNQIPTNEFDVDKNQFISPKFEDSELGNENTLDYLEEEVESPNRRLFYIIGSIIIGVLIMILVNYGKIKSHFSSTQSLVVEKGVNIRESPDSNSPKVGSIEENTRVEFLEKSIEENINGQIDNWYKVKSNEGVEGYIFGAYTDLKRNVEIENQEIESIEDVERSMQIQDEESLKRSLLGGVWKYFRGNFIIEFKFLEDNKFEFSDYNNDSDNWSKYTGKYTFLGPNSIKLQYDDSRTELIELEIQDQKYSKIIKNNEAFGLDEFAVR